ncbi:MAG: alpha/beta fold hydrolase [Burkholderiaceae bacterium]
MQRWRVLLMAALLAMLAACGAGDQAPVVNRDQAARADATTDDASADATDQTSAAGMTDDGTQLEQERPAVPVFAPDPETGAGQSFALGAGQWLGLDKIAGDSDAPLLIALHDLGASSAQWRPLIAQSPQSWRWLNVDLRGHGNASEPAAALDGDGHLQDLEQLIATLDDSRFVMVGSGLGARLALRLAQRHASRISHLVLIAADDGRRPPEALTKLRARVAALPPGAPAPDDFIAEWQQAAGIDGSPGGIERRVHAGTWHAGIASLSRPLLDAQSAPPPMQFPTLRLLGGRDQLLDKASADALGEDLPADVLLLHADSGRRPEHDDSTRTAERIARFLSPRGALHAASPVRTVGIAQTNALTASGIERLLARDITGEALCDVRIVELEYQSTGANGESTNASAMIGLPDGGHPQCQGPRPLLLYAHGTSADRDYDFATSSEGFGGIALAMFAARGYIVLGPQYAGYGRSWLDYHPYLKADAQSADMIDALRAAEQWLAAQARPWRELFVAGYSQGGHVAMATHRALERDHAGRFTVNGSFPMSGPYALERSFEQILSGRPVQGAAPLAAFALSARLRSNPGSGPPARLFESPYDARVPGLFPGGSGADEALARDLIPANLLASGGSPYLLRPGFVADYLANADEPMRAAFAEDVVIDWTPVAPLGLCGGSKDPVVFFDNSQQARDAFARRGVVVPLFDLDNSDTLPGGRLDSMYLRLRLLFAFTDDLSGYHAALAPFCAHYARDFFEALRR